MTRASSEAHGITIDDSDEFIALYEDWQADGGRYYGISEANAAD